MRKDIHYFWDVQMLLPLSMQQVTCADPLSETTDTLGSEQAERKLLPS